MNCSPSVFQARGRRRTLTPPPWLPPMYERNHVDYMDDTNRALLRDVMSAENSAATTSTSTDPVDVKIADLEESTRRVGLLARKIGMMPQWTKNGDRMLCTLLEICDNHVIGTLSPDEWYRRSLIGKRKAFNREGPLWKVTVGAVNDNADRYSEAYRRQFVRANVPVKKHLGSFLVSEEAVPTVGTKLDVRHFCVGQFVTATGKSIDWGFQGGMHRWGMRGQPTRNTTKSHRRIGSVGSVGDARIWPGKRMPGHMGYEWVTLSGLEVVRMNTEKQVIYVKGNVPGDIESVLLLKDCVQPEKRLKSGPIPTWTPSLDRIEQVSEEESEAAQSNEILSPKLFSFSSSSIIFSDEDAKKSVGRDKTKAKIAKVKK